MISLRSRVNHLSFPFTNFSGYSKNATVYIAGHSLEKGDEALKLARATSPISSERLEFLFLDLAALTTIAQSAMRF